MGTQGNAGPGCGQRTRGNLMFKRFAIGASGAVLAAPAFAALPSDVTDALTAAATDAGLLWVALIGVAVVGVGYKLGIIGLKKAPGMVK